MPRRPKPKPSGNALVPIDGKRVRDALSDQGLSNREAGRRIAKRLYGREEKPGDAESIAVRLNNVLKGQGTCERDLRRVLAMVLDFPETWLSGEDDRLPYATYMTGGGGQTDAGPMPNRRQLATHRFNSAIAARLNRIRRSEGSQASSAYSVCLSQLIDPTTWRRSMLRLSPAATAEDVAKATPILARKGFTESAAESEAREHLVKAFLYILRPWIDGRLEIDEDYLVAVAMGLEKLADMKKQESQEPLKQEG
jgi:hypothetical protein